MLYQAQEFAQITPLEIDILYQLVGLQHQTGYGIHLFMLIFLKNYLLGVKQQSLTARHIKVKYIVI